MKIEKLQYITQGTSESSILEEIESVVNSGIVWVQLRIKNEALLFEDIAAKAQEICKKRAVFIINDRVDIAKSIDADGVHLGLKDMPIAEARSVLGKSKIIGGTGNTLGDCLARQSEGVDYIGLGPYKFTTTKENLSPLLGLSGYREITFHPALKTPIVAVGGITFEDVGLLKSNSGIWGVAVSGLLKHATNKEVLIKNIKTILHG